MKPSPRHLSVKAFIPALSVLGFLLGCRGLGGPLKLTRDPAAKQILDRPWRLYSRDLIDTTGGQVVYLSRALMDSCLTRVIFYDKDSLRQYYSCSGGPVTDTTGHWNWYTQPGTLFAQIFTNSKEEDVKQLFKLDGDTLQMEIRPTGFPDSVELKQYLKTLTFIGQ